MSDRGVSVTVQCSGCYAYLGGEDTEVTADSTVIVEAPYYQQHHECKEQEEKR